MNAVQNENPQTAVNGTPQQGTHIQIPVENVLRFMSGVTTHTSSFAKTRPYLAMAICVALGIGAYWGWHKVTAASPPAFNADGSPANAAAATAETITPAQARQYIGRTVKVTFVVAGGGANKDGTVRHVNSAPNYKDPTNLDVVTFPRKSPQAPYLDGSQIKGRTITATGVISEYKGGLQLVVNEPGQVIVK